MTDVIALGSFDHDGMRRRGEVFRVSLQVAAELVRAGLVALHEVAEPPARKPRQKAKK